MMMKKKKMLACLCLVFALILTGCGDGGIREAPSTFAPTPAPTAAPTPESAAEPAPSQAVLQPTEAAALPAYDKLDYDLTLFNENMVYAMLFDMAASPDRYRNSVVKLQGLIERRTNGQGEKVLYCVAYDETNCCSIGVELRLREDSKTVKNGFDAIVVGVYDAYREDGENKGVLMNALAL